MYQRIMSDHCYCIKTFFHATIFENAGEIAKKIVYLVLIAPRRSIYVKIKYWDQKCDISDEFWNCFNYSIQCAILSIKDSYVQKIIVKDSSVNNFDLLTQAFMYYVSNIGHQNHCKKADLKRSKYVESLAKESLPWINDISIEIKCKKVKILI